MSGELKIIELTAGGRPNAQFVVMTWAAPLQIRGIVAGVPFYFRERHDRWTLEKFDSPRHAIMDIAGELVAAGEVTSRGGMTLGDALKVIFDTELMNKLMWGDDDWDPGVDDDFVDDYGDNPA